MRGIGDGPDVDSDFVRITPRVRGIVRDENLQDSVPGITPACAGNSQCALSGNIGRRDHPRVCGE